MSFQQKKIKLETLGEYLSSVREKLGMTAAEAAEKSNLKLLYLEYLESGNYAFLPADVYVTGFLRQLSELYCVDSMELIEQYKKERGILAQLHKAPGLLNRTGYNKFAPKLVITPKILSIFLGGLFVVLTISYIIWQVWSINKTPSLNISEPKGNAVIAGSFVSVSGKTDAGMLVSVNGQNIFVDNQGGFNTQLSLTPGPKDIVVLARNRFDKTLSKTVHITGAAPTTDAEQSMSLKVYFTAPAALSFSIDDQPAQTMQFNPSDSKIFIARQKILISTTDAGATRVILNGQDLGALGRPREVLQNIPFLAENASAPSSTLQSH